MMFAPMPESYEGTTDGLLPAIPEENSDVHQVTALKRDGAGLEPKASETKKARPPMIPRIEEAPV